MRNKMNDLSTEYEKDFYAWLEHNIDLLKQGKVAEVDLANLIEELEYMGSRDRGELISHFRVLLTHLLKWQYQFAELVDKWGQFTGSSWRGSIAEHRKSIAKQLKMSPSLKRFLSDAMNEAYIDAVDIVSKETNIAVSDFPQSCPYTLEQVLDENFYP